MNKLLKTAFFFILFDVIYLTLTSKYFQKQIMLIQGSPMKINIFKLLLTYLVLILGYYTFVIRKNLSIKESFLLGLFVYAVYELTNYSIFNKWNLLTVLLDSLWGGILFALIRYFVK